METPRRKSFTPTVNFPTLVTVVITGVTVALAANAQVSSSLSVSLTNILAGPEISTTEVPLSNSFQPTTPWPMPSTVSQTVLQAPHDLLAYVGVETSAKRMLGADFATWQSHFANKTDTDVLPQGLLISNGCLKPCDTQKSLLIVNPETQHMYAAMVTSGKVAMWPSLMSWPDDAIPALKRWLADATDDDDKK